MTIKMKDLDGGWEFWEAGRKYFPEDTHYLTESDTIGDIHSLIKQGFIVTIRFKEVVD